MAKKIVVVTTDGDSREDGNVYYANFLIVESNTLNFDEDIFSDDGTELGMAAVAAELRALGYTVEEPDCEYVTAQGN